MSTLNITPMFSPSLIRQAFDDAGIKGVTINDNGGMEIEDTDTALGSLGGAIMELHVLRSMVMDSNGVAVERAAEDLRGLDTGSIREAREHAAEIAETLDSVARNLRQGGR
jgi:hypothetical protein